MSERDREKWNARYMEGAYSERLHPAPLVGRWSLRLPAVRAGRLRALDVACGAGRNALWLAEAGFDVDAVDVSDVGLERARATAEARSLRIHLRQVDLDDGLPAEFDGYDLIVVIRYLNRTLLPLLTARLRPGGHILCEIHLESEAAVIGPKTAAFRVAPGELERLVPGVEVLELEEGLFTDPDGRPVALARLVGRRRD